jgi:hypothetical protein
VVALQVQWADLLDVREHLRIYHYLGRAFSPALQQREYCLRRGYGPVDRCRRMPGVPLAELVGAADIRCPGPACPAPGTGAPVDSYSAGRARQPIRDGRESCRPE